MNGTGCRVQFYTLQVFVNNKFLYIIYWHIYNFRFSELSRFPYANRRGCGI